MRFSLEIELGNDAMSVPEDVGDALRDVAETMRMYGWSENIKSSTIRDANGNTVGKWEVTDTPADPIERMYAEAFEEEAPDGEPYTKTEDFDDLDKAFL